MTGGWQTQLDRVRRWYQRATVAKDQTDRHDFLYAFFENAIHLRDWLKDTGATSEKDLKGFFDSNEEMRLCRDLANSHKHYSLSSEPSQVVPPSEAYEWNLDSSVSLVILSDGKKHDALELAARILRLWEGFTASRSNPV